MKKKAVLLVDCNSFFVSCERVFRPDLKHQPVIVLSSNDGCAVARSPEAKKLGIEMGAPFFKIRDLIYQHKVRVFSSNFPLYGDLSARVMETLSQFTPEMEIYSIDEAFLHLTPLALKSEEELMEYAHKIRATVYQHTGIPTSVGLAPTKVLAKIATDVAKSQGLEAFSLMQTTEQERILPQIPVERIWGVGRKSALKLRGHGIKTAKQLKEAPEALIQKILTVQGRRIQEELREAHAIAPDSLTEGRKQVLCSRSFGQPITEKEELEQAVAQYVTRATERLRKQGSVAGGLTVFTHTNRFKDPDYFAMSSLTLETPTSSTSLLIKKSFELLEKIFTEGLSYKKAGVMLFNLQDKSERQMGLFGAEETLAQEKILEVVDKINKSFGSDTLKWAACGTDKPWATLCENKSPAYTTRWEEILKVH